MRKILMSLLWSASTAASAAESGVAGKLELTHACHGPQAPDAGCIVPYPHGLLQLQDRGGNTVVSAAADETGSFSMAAPAGRYRLHVVVDGVYPRCDDVMLQVRRKRITRLTLQCDAGMR